MLEPPKPENAKAPGWETRGFAETTIESKHDSNSKAKRGLQLRCEACSSPFDKGAGRRKRFCSDACRATQRRKEARNASEAQSSIASGNALNRQTKSIACKRLSADPYPTPIDLLGQGCRWPTDGRLDRETWQKILWREVGAP